MITKIQISPSVGVFHVNVTLNSWEIPAGQVYLNSRVLISDFLVDDRERLVLPRREGELYLYQLPPGHSYSFSYQIYLEASSDLLFIEDDGSYLPSFGQDSPSMRKTQITLPEDLVVLSSHRMERMQRRKGLLRFFFEGEEGGFFSIAPYYGDRIFSGELYHLKRDINREILNRFLKNAWDYMYKNYGDIISKGPISYIGLDGDRKPFARERLIFFGWPEREKPRDFEEVVLSYLALGWQLDKNEPLDKGLLMFFLGELVEDFYSREELEGFYKQHGLEEKRVISRPLESLVARELSLGFWILLRDLKDFLSGEVFYPIMKLILGDLDRKPLSLEALVEAFSDLSWKEDTRSFLEGRVFEN